VRKSIQIFHYLTSDKFPIYLDSWVNIFCKVDFKLTNILGFLPTSITSWNDLETFDVMYKADWTKGMDWAEFWDLCDSLDRPFKHDIVCHLGVLNLTVSSGTQLYNFVKSKIIKLELHIIFNDYSHRKS
jgi:hypothetical protein